MFWNSSVLTALSSLAPTSWLSLITIPNLGVCLPGEGPRLNGYTRMGPACHTLSKYFQISPTTTWCKWKGRSGGGTWLERAGWDQHVSWCLWVFHGTPLPLHPTPFHSGVPVGAWWRCLDILGMWPHCLGRRIPWWKETALLWVSVFQLDPPVSAAVLRSVVYGLPGLLQ